MEELFKQLIAAVNTANTPTFLDRAPIILSAISVFAAIYIPWKIAKKQNQIAIFDKLYTAYSQLLLVKSFAEAIKSYSFSGDSQDVHRTRALFAVHFKTAFGYQPDIVNIEESIGSATAALRKSETQAYMVPLLISKNRKEKESCAKKVSVIYENLFLLTTEVVMFYPDKATNTNQILLDFCDSVTEYFDLFGEKIEKTLLCKK